MKEMSKNKVDIVRRRMIQEGDAKVEKLQSDLEMYKLKVIELRLWKTKWRNQQRSNESKKRLLKEKLEKRRAFINDQIQKGYMHKTCKVLIHSRAKFPFEEGFDQNNLKRTRRGFPEDNLSYLIKGTFLAKDGRVYPCKKKTTDVQNTTMRKPRKNAPTLEEDEFEEVIDVEDDDDDDDDDDHEELDEEDRRIVEPIFASNDQDQYIIHNLGQEPFEVNPGAVIHFIQIDQNQAQGFQRLL